MNKEKEVMEAIIDWWYKPTKVSTRKMFEDLAKSINNLYQAENIKHKNIEIWNQGIKKSIPVLDLIRFYLYHKEDWCVLEDTKDLLIKINQKG